MNRNEVMVVVYATSEIDAFTKIKKALSSLEGAKISSLHTDVRSVRRFSVRVPLEK